jgi:NAD(P)-dependent dehydrogenase (short-subunit alcohol dehydrogenase family)
VDKRTVVVTGGKRGIGAAICAAFLERGCQVVAVDKDFAGGLARDGEREGLYTYQADISQPLEVASFAQTMEELGPIHVLVNNAGYGITKPLEELAVDEWDAVLNTNLRGAFLMVKYTLPLLKQGKGSVINIASTRAFMSEPNTEAYSASKGGIVALTHALAASLGQFGIRVNCISPGWIETNPEAVLTLEDHSQHLVGRVGVPGDIAQACVYLASPEAGFITGTNLTIDGGMTVKMIYV